MITHNHPPPHTQAFLAIEDIGDTLESVEALISKHENFEKSLSAQEEKFKALDEMASSMVVAEHYATMEAHAKREEVRGRMVSKHIPHYPYPTHVFVS